MEICNRCTEVELALTSALDGREGGSFIDALVRRDYEDAVIRADSHNLQHFGRIVALRASLKPAGRHGHAGYYTAACSDCRESGNAR